MKIHIGIGTLSKFCSATLGKICSADLGRKTTFLTLVTGPGFQRGGAARVYAAALNAEVEVGRGVVP